MSGVLHPVGPEPSETYWVRRAVVIGVALVLVIILMVALFNLGGGSQAAPAATPGPLTPSADVSSASPTPSTSSSPTPSESATPSASASASATPSASASSKASEKSSEKTSGTESSAKSSAESSSKDSAKSTSNDSAKSSSKDDSTSSNKAGTAAAPAACSAAELKPVLSGSKRYAKPKQAVDFGLAFVNQSTSTCTVALSGDNLELKIYSGKDRIWSTDDCSTAIKPVTAALAPQKAISLKLTWDGRRSAKSCQQRPEIPRAGTYFVTSQLSGAKPVQFRLVLHN